MPFNGEQTLIAIDQLVNALLGGWADETLSARCYRKRHKRIFRIAEAVIDSLFFFQLEHCKEAYRSERLRLQSPPEERA